MQFEKITVPTVKEVFINNIEQKILSNEIRVGEQLPPERELAKSMGISKTIVHEGLKELEKIGFVYTVSGKGTYVADYLESGTIETLTAIMKQQNNILDSATHTAMVEMRILIEPAAMTFFGEKATDDDLHTADKYMQRALQAFDSNESNLEIAQKLFDYHHFIYKKCGNNVLALMCNMFEEVAVPSVAKFIDGYGKGMSKDWLIDVHEKLMKRDGRGAAEELMAQVSAYGKHLEVPIHDLQPLY